VLRATGCRATLAPEAGGTAGRVLGAWLSRATPGALACHAWCLLHQATCTPASPGHMHAMYCHMHHCLHHWLVSPLVHHWRCHALAQPSPHGAPLPTCSSFLLPSSSVASLMRPRRSVTTEYFCCMASSYSVEQQGAAQGQGVRACVWRGTATFTSTATVVSAQGPDSRTALSTHRQPYVPSTVCSTAAAAG
jgi:hypothetical protein